MDPDGAGGEEEVERLVPDFAEDGVHHDEEADGDGETDADELARWRAAPVEGTKWPSRMPVATARIIHITRNRSRKERPFWGGMSVEAAGRSWGVVVSLRAAFDGSELLGMGSY